MHAVIFDIDGTLLQSKAVDDALYRKSVESVVGTVKLRPGLGDYEYVTDTGILLQILEDNAISANQTLIRQIRKTFFASIENYVHKSGPFEEIAGAKSLIGRLTSSKHHAVGIATGGWRHTALLKLESAGFDISNIPLATSDDAVDRRGIMHIALASLGGVFDSVTYFGDGEWDRTACTSLGWTFCAVGAELRGIENYDNSIFV